MSRFRLFKDIWIGRVFFGLSLLAILTAVAIGAGLYWKAAPILHSQPLSRLLFSTEWKPLRGAFGFWAYIVGSLLVTGLAIGIALPLSVLCAVYLSEFARPRVKQVLIPFIDLLSGIPPIIYGVWGVLTIVPYAGYSALAGGVVLAVMVFPLLISILLEVFDTVPTELKNASLALGAGEWEMARSIVLRKSRAGILAATILSISRALGETIAVLMVCGNIAVLPHSVFDSVYPLPALIANNYGDMLSIPQYDAALMLAALILFVIIFLFNAVSRIVLYRLEKRNFI